MPEIIISVSEDRLRQVQEIASRFRVTPEELARVGLEELLTRPEDQFRQALEHVLTKNAELYQRLA